MSQMAPDDNTAKAMHTIAHDRGLGWEALARCFSFPDQRLLDSLQSGEIAGAINAATVWTGPDSERFAAPLLLLDTMVRNARRTGHVATLERLATEHERLGATTDGPVLCRRIASMCSQESAAWEAGDHLAAKELRAGQYALLTEESTATLDFAMEIVENAEVKFYVTIARLLTTYLSFEIGKDFDRQLFPTQPR